MLNFVLRYLVITSFASLVACGGSSTPATYTVSGTITAPPTTNSISSITLQNNGTDNLTFDVYNNNQFTFSNPLSEGSSYNVTVLSQPTSPSQTCIVTNGTGTVSNANTPNISVTCITNSYTIGGTVTGLAQGASVVLSNSDGEELTISGNGAYTFINTSLDGSPLAPGVDVHPTSPSQTCTITNSPFILSGANVTNLDVICVTDTFSVGGSVTGLSSGASVTLQNNGGDNLDITADGNFTFDSPLIDLSDYNVTVLTQPTVTNLVCTVTNNISTLNGVDVTDVAVTCIDLTGRFINQSYTPYNNTHSVILGDLDSDGDLDLAAGNIGQANLIYMNDGAGDFTDSGQRLGGYNTTSVTLGDIDGDGDLDLIAGNTNIPVAPTGSNSSNQATLIYINNGTGTFTASTQTLQRSYTRSVVLGDIDGDGDLDLVIGNDSDQANLIYVNDGSGHFIKSSQVLESNSTSSVTLVDIDDDGDLDLIEGNTNNQDSLVYINDGLGIFTDSGQLLELTGTTSIILGDVDGDGDLDLVSGSGSQGIGSFVYINDGAGNFIDSGQALGVTTQSTFSINLGDVDGDGDLDLVTGNTNGQINEVFINDGTGNFTDSGQALGHDFTKSVILGDIDGDGDLDLIAGNTSNQVNQIYINDGLGNFSGIRQNSTTSVILGDVDGDGDLDLVSGNSNQANLIYMNDGAGNFTDSGQALGNNYTSSIALGDVDGDGDGDLDLVTGNSLSQANLVYINDGNGIFTDSGQTLGTDNTTSVALGDIDNDGDLDLVVGNLSDQPNRIYINDSTGIFTDSGQTLGVSFTYRVTLGDIDDDGDLDLVVGNGENQANQVYVNDSAGNFTDSGQALGLVTTRSVTFGDIDGDGDLDLLSANAVLNGSVVYTNDGSGSFTNNGQILPGASAMNLGDIDGDGDLDLVISSGDPKPNLVYLNDGAGNFTDSGQALGFSATGSVILGDIDGDNDLDLIAGNWNNANEIYINLTNQSSIFITKVSTITVPAITCNVFSGFNTISWNGSQFLAAGNGVMITSVDGITWSPRNTFTGNGILAIDWDGSQYIAAGSNGTIIRGGF